MTDVNLTGSAGTPGVNGTTPGQAGTPGGSGGNAAPPQNTGNGIDTLNTEEATGGAGGAGGNGGSGSGTGGDAGAGGNGGNATASTSTTFKSTAGVTSTATATGGAGGNAGTPGNFDIPGLNGGQGASGGAGGTATASAAADSAGIARALATATGGAGGASNGPSGFGGAGGIANNTTASASGFSAYATVTQTGGAGGNGYRGTTNNLGASGGAGASSTLINAVSGTTTGGTLGLYQTATGGAGGDGFGHGVTAGQAGTATSSLTFNDVTANTTHASRLIGDSAAIGGAGGGGYSAKAGGTATAAIALTGAHTTTATATAAGGQGGYQYSVGGVGGGATATAMATTSSPTEAAHAIASATGGAGGQGLYGSGGDGGIASNTTASASGFSAYATVTQTGGAGGYGGVSGGAGASSTLVNAVSGTTAGGTLGLYQTATGGAGGNAYSGSVGQPGTATSRLTFNDVTANTTHATRLIGSSTAIGGAGGGGAAGGAATAAIALTGANVVIAHAAATTANGQLATANATATGGTGSDDSTAVTQGGGSVTTVSAFAQAPVDGTATTLSESIIGNQLGSSGFNGSNNNSYAFATEVPNSSLVTSILNSNSNLATALRNGTVLGLATEGASYSTTASGSRTYTSTIAWTLDTTALSGHLIAGLINDQSFGSGFSSLDFNVVENGTTIFDRNFTTLSAAQTFFTNDALDLGTFTGGPKQVIDFDFSLTTSDSGAGFAAQFLLGTNQPLTGNVVLNTATEHVALADSTTVATFTDPNRSETASNFTAVINWGDGTTSSGTVAGSNGAFTVSGGHTYADEGSFPIGVTITDPANNLSLSGTVAAAEADVLTAYGPTFTANAGQAFSGTVANFTDSDTSNVASDFSATINWGDGTTSAGVITDTAGAISVSGTHTYASSGQDAVTVTLTDDAPGTAVATAKGTANVVGLAGLAGQITLTAAAEGVALPVTTRVATFTDPNRSDTASSFTAVINWGDGTTSSGTVAGSNGAFTVSGGHTYADEGSFPIGVTITDPANNLSLSGTVAAAEADVLTAYGPTFTANAGQAFSGTVANFTDSDTSNVASDFSATINWGDGTTSAGVITDTAGAISVSGTHTYASSGQDAVTVTLTDDAPGTAVATAKGTANVVGLAGLAGQITLTAAAEGVALPVTTRVATFTDPNRSDTASSFTAVINWGDGTTSSGTVAGSNGAFTVSGGHTYADEGSFPIGVTITDPANNLSLSGTVAAAEADVLTAYGPTFTANAGQAFSGTVANFTDSDTSNVASDFSATINWGDGTTSAGVITDTAGAISVSGTHTYASSGQDAVTVTLTDDAPGTAVATAKGTANVVGLAGLAGQITLTAAAEGVALPVTTRVATFTDPNRSDTASSFTAVINWGDGTTSSGTVAGSNGAFTVSGGHTYADEGSFPIGVTITDPANNLSLSGTVAAAEADVLTAYGPTFTANAGQAFSGTVANFTDSDTSNVASDFSATINWGDGTTSAGVITDTAGAISVSGTHTYASSGQDAVTVTLTDDAPGTATATARSTAAVSHAAVAGNLTPFPASGLTNAQPTVQNSAGSPPSSPGLDHAVALFSQFIAAGFPEQHGGLITTNALSQVTTNEQQFLANPHHG